MKMAMLTRKVLLRDLIEKYPTQHKYFESMSISELQEFTDLPLLDQNIKLGRITDLWHRETYIPDEDF